MRSVCCAVLFFAALASVSAHDPITTKVTWNREIAPIFQARCVSCHSQDGRAPMPLATYNEARPWARAIREEVLARRMPKWPVVRGYGDFRNDPSLSAFEIALITAWVDGGAPQSREKGSPAVAPPLAAQAPLSDEGSRDERTLPCRSQALPAGELAALRPRLPAGGSLRLTLEFPDGDQEPLLWIRDFDPRFARLLRLRTATRIPPRTRLRVDPSADDCTIGIVGGWK
jgi:hypothetical protein